MENNPGIYLSKVMFKPFEKQIMEHPFIAAGIFIGVTIGVPVATYYLKKRCDKDFERTKHEYRMEEIKAKREQKENNKGKEQESLSETSVNSRSKSVMLSDVDFKKYEGHYDDDQLIGKLISVKDIVLIYGETGIGKSTFTYQLAFSIARGVSCSVIPEKYNTTKEVLRQQVLYYDFEHEEKDLYRIFGNEDLSECHCLELVFPKEINDLSSWITDVKDKLTEIKNDVVVFLDNFTCIKPNADTNTVKDFIREQLVSVRKEGEARGQRITFIIVYHPNKKGELFGSVNFRNLSSDVLLLKKSDTDNNKLILKVEKNRQYGDMIGMEFLEEKDCSESGWKHFVGEEICDEAVVETKEEAKEEAKAGKYENESKYTDEDGAKILEQAKNGSTISKIMTFMNDYWQINDIKYKGNIKSITKPSISKNISLYCKKNDAELYNKIMSMHKSGMTDEAISLKLSEEGINMKYDIIRNINNPPEKTTAKKPRSR